MLARTTFQRQLASGDQLGTQCSRHRRLGPVDVQGFPSWRLRESRLQTWDATLIRSTLTDSQWHIIAPHCLGRECDPGRTGPDPGLFVEAVLWIARTGCP